MRFARSERTSTGIEETVDHYDEIRGLDASPIIIMHSFGGAFTEVLLDRFAGVGRGGGQGDHQAPFAVLSRYSVLKNPANNHRAAVYTLGITRVHEHDERGSLRSDSRCRVRARSVPGRVCELQPACRNQDRLRQ